MLQELDRDMNKQGSSFANEVKKFKESKEGRQKIKKWKQEREQKQDQIGKLEIER